MRKTDQYSTIFFLITIQFPTIYTEAMNIRTNDYETILYSTVLYVLYRNKFLLFVIMCPSRFQYFIYSRGSFWKIYWFSGWFVCRLENIMNHDTTL